MFLTGRLRLRGFEGSKDVDNLMALTNNALLPPLIAERPIAPGTKHRDFLIDLVGKALMFCMIEEVEGQKSVGIIGFMNQPDARNRNGQFSIALLPEFWNKGYGTEAAKFVIDHGFKWLALHRISLTVYEGNDRAIALYQKLGFVEEGRLRKSLWDSGGWRDIICMGILEDEWAARKEET